MNLNITNLNTKALTVRLTISKPTTSHRDVQAETFAQQQLADTGLRVSNSLFRTGPIRELLNLTNTVYTTHKQETLPYIDRGPRLLTVSNYEKYRSTMRALVSAVETRSHELRPAFAQHVNDDIRVRGARAALTDYPSEDEFFDSLRLKFTFAPLPDKAHVLFDMSDEDRAALEQQMQEVIDLAKADLTSRLRDPMKHLLDKLRVPVGAPGSIFRDSAVENVVDAVQTVRRMAMDDPEILAACDEVSAAFVGHGRNPQVLRESPIVREQMVNKLADIEKKMGWLNG
jgi:hypothetical protein